MNDQKFNFLMSFLMILVIKSGGQIEIDNLSEYAGLAYKIEYKMKPGNNGVTITAKPVQPEEDVTWQN